MMNDCLTQYFRCPEQYIRLGLTGLLSEASGYFRLGPEAMCYGKYHGRSPASSPTDTLCDAVQDIEVDEGTTYLPLDLKQVVDSLRYERYVGRDQHSLAKAAASRLYYFFRPVLFLSLRKRLQKARLRGWEKIVFPRWPVDCSVDNMFEELMMLSLRSQGLDSIPFVWFWPDGASSCAIMTHDVETALGRNYCSSLMDIDDSFGIKASFQVVPERRYEVTPAYLSSIRNRAFELNVQDLNHDGLLYKNHQQFRERAAKINWYGREYGAQGFRAAVLYRNQEWYDELDFAYDMSVPNVAHLDPQPGGCCTVMPYFVKGLLELPVTTTQDYMLFHLLNDYSIDLWKRQAEIIMEKHGLISFIVHPDYVTTTRERNTYETLLAYLASLRSDKNVWIPTPGEVNCWWRQRAEMKLVRGRDGWRIEGAGSERACIAYASEKDGRVVYSLEVPIALG
jgi:hypothetical protein